MNIKIETTYKAKVFFESSVSVNGSSYLIIYGEHINGYFCCIPNYGWGCEMAEPSDVFYNCNKLMSECGVPIDIANAIAKSIESKDKDMKKSKVKSEENLIR